MKRRIPVTLTVLLGLTAILLTLTVTWARSNSAFSQLNLLVDVRHRLVSDYVTKPDEQAMMERAVRGMVASLNDPFTDYFTPEQLKSFNRFVTGTFTGIGAEVEQTDHHLRIVTPLQDSPAWKAGVLAGDIVLEIDGKSTSDMTLPDAVNLLRGKPGTHVKLLVQHKSGGKQTVDITRAKITLRTVRGFERDGNQHFDYMLDPQRKVGYVRITQFTRDTADEMHKALTTLRDAGVKAVIVDVRFNPGGLLESARDIANMFLKPGRTIVSVKGRVVPKQVYESTKDTILPDVPVVIVANEASASAAEILTGALKDNHRALFVGTRTFGKGSVQQVKLLPNNEGGLKITEAYYYIPSGRMIHRRPNSKTWGVDPTEGDYVPMTPKQVRAMVEARRERDALTKEAPSGPKGGMNADWIRAQLKDPQLAAAFEAILGKLKTGQWAKVGQSNAQALVLAGEIENLNMERQLLTDRLNKVNAQLAKLHAPAPGNPGSTPGNAATAPATQANGSVLAPTSHEAAQQRIEAQQKGQLEQVH